ncbi:MAG: hypothetical protein OCD01_04245 [Fibrobacterales bacterium]
MTPIHILILCTTLILSLFVFTGCEGCALVQEPMVDDVVPLDTIQYTYEYDTTGLSQDTLTLYAWKVNRYGMEWTDTSQTEPLLIDSSYGVFGSIPTKRPYRTVILPPQIQINYYCIDCAPKRNPYIPVDTMHISYPNPLDTIYLDAIYRDCYPRHVFDTIWAEVDPDSTESFLKSHPPRITNKDELRLLVDTLQEGYSVNAPVVVEHIGYDSVYIEILSDTLDFLENIAYNCPVPSDGMFYHPPGELSFSVIMRCPVYLFKVSVASSFNKIRRTDIVTMHMSPNRTHVGNEYEQVIAVKNRYGVGDTLTLKSVIVPFDSSVFEPQFREPIRVQ